MAAGFTLYRSRSGGSAGEMNRTATCDGDVTTNADCFGFGLSSGVGTFASFADSATNTYTKDLDTTDAGSVGRVALFRSFAVTHPIINGVSTVTLNGNGVSFKGLAAGYMTGGVMDGVDKAATKKNGTGTSMTTNTTGTLLRAVEIGWCIFLFDGSPSFTEPAGWTNAFGTGNYLSTTSTVVNMAACFIETSTTSALTPTATLGASQNWGSIVGTYFWRDTDGSPLHRMPLGV